MPGKMDQALTPTADPAWVRSEKVDESLRDSSRETRFAISNGFLGIRCARNINRAAAWVTSPCTSVAGLFDKADGKDSIPELVAAPDWLQVSITQQGVPLIARQNEVSSRLLTLDLKRGALVTGFYLYGTSMAKVRLQTLRFVSLKERAIGLQSIQLEVEAGEGEITLEASFDGMNQGLLPKTLAPKLGVWRTAHSGKSVAIAVGLSLRVDGQEIAEISRGQFKWAWSWQLRPGQIVSFERIVAIARADTPDIEAGSIASENLGAARRLGWRGVVVEHEAAWAQRWTCSDVGVEGDSSAQQDLRFALYHLNGAANPDDAHVSIGARALTGRDYLGHVFWDTEIFLLPFYILTWPEAARSLLLYRFHTLDGARAKAAKMGWRGALYAWESADTGAEATPEHVTGPDRKVVEVLSGKQEQHISADIAYAVWQYWQATADVDFLQKAGAEILFETARFWASRAVLEADGLRHIRGVIGPDEYHEGIDDNAFTNVMARRNIRYALDTVALLRDRWPDIWERLSSHLRLDEAELALWLNVTETIVIGLDLRTGLFEQFAGFNRLEKINLADYAGRSVPMDVILGRERTQKSQVVKQADVVALLALLPDEFTGKMGAENFRYYESRCSHGSSLSRPMHGLVAARLGYSEMALKFFQETAAIDLSDSHVAIGGGIHIAALGGLWQMAVLGFAGVSLRADGIAIDPKLPASWRGLTFPIQWHGRCLRIKIDQAEQYLEATLEGEEPVTLTVCGVPHAVRCGQPLHVPLESRVATQ